MQAEEQIGLALLRESYAIAQRHVHVIRARQKNLPAICGKQSRKAGRPIESKIFFIRPVQNAYGSRIHTAMAGVHSLYLDSDRLTTYWATVHCEMERFKLRLRYYDEDPNTPLFFELKRRVNDCV